MKEDGTTLLTGAEVKPESYCLTAEFGTAETPFSRWLVVMVTCPCGAKIAAHTAGSDQNQVRSAVAMAHQLLNLNKQVQAKCPSCGASHYISRPLIETPKPHLVK